MSELALVRVEPTPDAFAEAVSGAVSRGAGTLAVLPDDAFAKASFSRAACSARSRRIKPTSCA